MVEYTRFPAEHRTRRKNGRRQPDAPVATEIAVTAVASEQAPERTASRHNVKASNAALPMMVSVFILATCTPIYFNLGSLALTPARVVMILLFIPVMLKFVSGAAGKWYFADKMMFAYSVWIAISLLAYDGASMIQYIGITIIETMTPYFLARTMIRNREQYNAFLKFMLVIIVCMAGLAAVEATTGIPIVNRILDIPFRVYQQVPDSYEKRLGMMRAQATFLHPILFGVVMALFLAPFIFMPRKDAPGGRGGFLYALPAALACFFSLSTGAWLAMNVQLGLMLWGRMMRENVSRWKILMILTVIGYVVVDLISNRTPFEVFISYMALNSHTAYWRVLIFMFGMDNVWANPFFGIGLGDWVRPSWMFSASVDNFWLLNAMRYGIPGFLLISAMFLGVILAMARARIADEFLRNQRNAIIFAIIGCALSLCTVHIWSTTLYMVMFFIGTGMWMADIDDGEDANPKSGTSKSRAVKPKRASNTRTKR